MWQNICFQLPSASLISSIMITRLTLSFAILYEELTCHIITKVKPMQSDGDGREMSVDTKKVCY